MSELAPTLPWPENVWVGAVDVAYYVVPYAIMSRDESGIGLRPLPAGAQDRR